MTSRFNRIVVPVDFSGESSAAVRQALDLSDGDASRLHLIHVLLPLDTISPGVLLGDVTDEKREKAVRENMTKLADTAGAAGCVLATRIGSPGLEIADYAKDHSADLIVIPSHGYHGLKRMVLGSVAEGVIRYAECSVFVLRRSDAE